MNTVNEPAGKVTFFDKQTIVLTVVFMNGLQLATRWNHEYETVIDSNIFLSF